MLNFKNKTELLDFSFDLGLLLKSIFAIGEVIGGVSLFFLTPNLLNGIIFWMTQDELQEDPHDFIAQFLVNFGHHFSLSIQHSLAIYLLLHGLIKLVVLFLLWRKIIWSYPLSILIFSGFIIYQISDFFLTHSVFMIVVSLIDLVMIYLTFLEYQKMRGKWKEKI